MAANMPKISAISPPIISQIEMSTRRFLSILPYLPRIWGARRQTVQPYATQTTKLTIASVVTTDRMLLASQGSGRFGGLILVYGTLCIDRTRTIRQLPPSGGYAEILEERVLLGGEAANTAHALMKWGADFRLAGNPVGLDENGKILDGLIRASGLPTSDLETRESITPVCDIYVTPDGDRTMYGKGFATITDFLAPEKAPYESGGWFTLDSNLREGGDEAMRLAKAAGMRIYAMDLIEPAVALDADDFWQCSTDWIGVRGDVAHNAAWLQNWIDRHGCTAVLTDGKYGLIAGSPTVPARHLPPFPYPNIVDSTGAGDMFRAGMLYGLDRGWGLMRCLAFGAAAGCLKCQGLGAMSYVPTVDEIEAHIAGHPEVAGQYA